MDWTISRGTQAKCSVFAIALLLGFGAFVVQAQAAGCKTAPNGMACISSGSFVRGSTSGKSNERPTQKVTLPAFYIDKTEVTNKAYNECIKAGFCYRPYRFKLPKRFARRNQPAVYVSWHEAHKFCRWKGKRLPTASEWERAARGSAASSYSWGNDKPSCSKAHYRGCRPRRPKAVTRGKANSAGLMHMDGNVMEWVQDWYVPYRSCGSACKGSNPKGPCQGRQSCTVSYKRTVKGGAYNLRKKWLRSAVHRGFTSDYRRFNLGFRCASSSNVLLVPGKPTHMKSRPALPALKGPMSASKAKLFFGFPYDNLKEKKLCPIRYRSGANCRDPISYVKSNESRQFLFRPYIKNLGGAYIGVGADQNYNFIAWARSRYVWLMDYDPVIPLVHKIHRAFLLRSATGREFMSHFAAKHRKKSLKILRKVYKKDKDRVQIARVYYRYRATFYRHFNREFRRSKRSRKMRQFWVCTPRHYNYIRKLFKLNRVRAIPGDLLKYNSLRGAAAAAKKMGVTVRIMYFSNAEDYWLYPAHFRKHIANMPMDNLSVLLHTFSHPRWLTKKWAYFHYNIAHGKSLQRWVKTRAAKGGDYRGFYYSGARHLLSRQRVDGHKKGLTLLGMPTTKRKVTP